LDEVLLQLEQQHQRQLISRFKRVQNCSCVTISKLGQKVTLQGSRSWVSSVRAKGAKIAYVVKLTLAELGLDPSVCRVTAIHCIITCGENHVCHDRYNLGIRYKWPHIPGLNIIDVGTIA
jgi:hypothetical protein